MNTRNGKIARLPASVRHNLNLRLDDGQEGPELLDWLNSLPEVQKVLEDKFKGVPISKQNLSEWRQGGFQDWLLLQELRGQAEDMTEAGDDMAGSKPGAEVIDNVARILATKLGNLLVHWNGEVDEQTEARAKFLNGLVRSVVRLQQSTRRSNLERLKERELARQEKERENKDRREKMLLPTIYPSPGPDAPESERMLHQYKVLVMANEFEEASKCLLDGAANLHEAQSESVAPSQSAA